jgi:hypothetical protein
MDRPQRLMKRVGDDANPIVAATFSTPMSLEDLVLVERQIGRNVWSRSTLNFDMKSLRTLRGNDVEAQVFARYRRYLVVLLFQMPHDLTHSSVFDLPAMLNIEALTHGIGLADWHQQATPIQVLQGSLDGDKGFFMPLCFRIEDRAPSRKPPPEDRRTYGWPGRGGHEEAITSISLGSIHHGEALRGPLLG